jgi:NAD(P)-dependent dehydrogenase (short-subunit alcohol dehydrogenase family)
MKQVIVVTGASGGFGALAARALARSDHAVYAGMRDVAGRNAPQSEGIKAHAAQAASTFERSSSTSSDFYTTATVCSGSN